LLSVLFSNWIKYKFNPNTNVISQSNGNSIAITIQKNSYNQFILSGYINNYPVDFLIDTGANSVALPASIADKIGAEKKFRMLADTAGGRVESYHTTLDHIQIGDIQLKNIKAMIVPAMSDQYVLLGMSALEFLELRHSNDQLTLIVTSH